MEQLADWDGPFAYPIVMTVSNDTDHRLELRGSELKRTTAGIGDPRWGTRKAPKVIEPHNSVDVDAQSSGLYDVWLELTYLVEDGTSTKPVTFYADAEPHTLIGRSTCKAGGSVPSSMQRQYYVKGEGYIRSGRYQAHCRLLAYLQP